MKQRSKSASRPATGLHANGVNSHGNAQHGNLGRQYMELGFQPPKDPPVHPTGNDLGPVSFQTFVPCTITALG